MPRQAVIGPDRDGTARVLGSRAVRIDRRMLIDGVLSEGVSGQRFPSVNPATGKIVGFAPDGGIDDVTRAVAGARRVADGRRWSADKAFRVRCLAQLHSALVEDRESLRWMAVSETGATLRLTEGPYLDGPISAFGHYSEALMSYPMTESLGDESGCRSWIEKAEVGVVAIRVGPIHPLRTVLAALGPALAAGCTVVIKAAPEAALTTLALGELISTRTEIPGGVVNVLSSLDTSVDGALATHPGIDSVVFSGSVAAGRRFMAAASGSVKRIAMTPERKSTAIVLDDADHEACAEHIALMATSHAGQGSAPIARILVPARSGNSLVAEVARRLTGVRQGDPADARTWMGPLISDRRRDEVDEMVKRAIVGGATLVTGGHVLRPGYFYEPTLLTGVDLDSEAASTEIGGPVLVAVGHSDDQDAVRVANRSVCGPSGVVFGSHERALTVARGVRTGRMSINGGNYLGPGSPFGYAEAQSHSASGDLAAIDEYLERKTFAARIPERPRRVAES